MKKKQVSRGEMRTKAGTGGCDLLSTSMKGKRYKNLVYGKAA